MEIKTTQPNEVKKAWQKLKEIREKISPEKEYILGAIATYVYLVMLISPEQLPTQLRPMVELLDKLPMSRFSLWLTTTIAFLGSVDGARRIVIDSLPFYRAYLQVFLLNKIEE